jgi:hypothetical protein
VDLGFVANVLKEVGAVAVLALYRLGLYTEPAAALISGIYIQHHTHK